MQIDFLIDCFITKLQTSILEKILKREFCILADMDESSRLNQDEDPPPYESLPPYGAIPMKVFDSSPDTKPSAPPPSESTVTTDEEPGRSNRPKPQKYCFVAVLVIALIGILVASLFSYFHLKEPSGEEPFYREDNVEKSIFECNVENACGHADNTAAACIKIDNDEPGTKYWNNQGVTEIAYDSWTNIEEADLWCMPCCISDLNKNVEMFLCESLFPKDTVLQRNATYGRCGIDYNL